MEAVPVESKGAEAVVPQEQTEVSEVENQEQAYDPNAYPGKKKLHR